MPKGYQIQISFRRSKRASQLGHIFRVVQRSPNYNFILTFIQYLQKQLPISMLNFFNFHTQEGILFIDKTIYIKYLENYSQNYRYILFQPRHFGKSTLLNMLCAYYNIRNADIFENLFNLLYIGKSLIHLHSSHLVFSFDLTLITITSSITEMKRSFHLQINHMIRKFI